MAKVYSSVKSSNGINLAGTGSIIPSADNTDGISVGTIVVRNSYDTPGSGTIAQAGGFYLLRVKCWGAGGGASDVTYGGITLRGGGGGYANVLYTGTDWTTIGYSVGYAGRKNAANAGTIAKGGDPTVNATYKPGGGGGASLVATLSGSTYTLRCCAGGGGGTPGIISIMDYYYMGGGGGGSSGGTGGFVGSGGSGGTGGDGDTNNTPNGVDGDNMTLTSTTLNGLGGDGGSNSSSGSLGGCGGGGYGGGGSGATEYGSDKEATAGGGGGGYAPSGTLTQGQNGASGGAAANTGDADYTASAGQGGNQDDGNPGLIVIEQTCRAFEFAISMITAFLNPRTDNIYGFGNASYRWKDVYAASGTVSSSDRNLKKDITNCHLSLDFIRALRPVTFQYTDGKRPHCGFIAQDIGLILDHLNKGDFAGFIRSELIGGGSRYGLRYNEFIAPIVDSLQVLCTKLDNIEAALVEAKLATADELGPKPTSVRMLKLPSEIEKIEEKKQQNLRKPMMKTMIK